MYKNKYTNEIIDDEKCNKQLTCLMKFGYLGSCMKDSEYSQFLDDWSYFYEL